MPRCPLHATCHERRLLDEEWCTGERTRTECRAEATARAAELAESNSDVRDTDGTADRDDAAAAARGAGQDSVTPSMPPLP